MKKKQKTKGQIIQDNTMLAAYMKTACLQLKACHEETTKCLEEFGPIVPTVCEPLHNMLKEIQGNTEPWKNW